MKQLLAIAGAVVMMGVLATVALGQTPTDAVVVPIEATTDTVIKALGGLLLLVLSAAGYFAMAWLKSKSALANSAFAQSLFDRYNNACKVGVAMLENYVDGKIPPNISVTDPKIALVVEYLKRNFPDLFKGKTDSDVAKGILARAGSGPATDALIKKDVAPSDVDTAKK